MLPKTPCKGGNKQQDWISVLTYVHLELSLEFRAARYLPCSRRYVLARTSSLNSPDLPSTSYSHS